MSKLLQQLLAQNNLSVSNENVEVPTQTEGQPEGLVTLTDGVDENSPVGAAEPTIEPGEEIKPEVVPEVPAEGILAPADGEVPPVVPTPEENKEEVVLVTEPSLEDLELVEEVHEALMEAHAEHVADHVETEAPLVIADELSEAHSHLEALAEEVKAPEPEAIEQYGEDGVIENAEDAGDAVHAELTPEAKEMVETAIAVESRALQIPAFGIESLGDRVKAVSNAIGKALAAAYEAVKKFTVNMYNRLTGIFSKIKNAKKDISNEASAELINDKLAILTGNSGDWKDLDKTIGKFVSLGDDLLKFFNSKHSSAEAESLFKTIVSDKFWTEHNVHVKTEGTLKPVKVTGAEYKASCVHGEKAEDVLGQLKKALESHTAKTLADNVGGNEKLAVQILRQVKFACDIQFQISYVLLKSWIALNKLQAKKDDKK